MPSRSGSHHSRYDDPYVFDDPYRHSMSPVNDAGYEYVGTEEAPISPHPHHSLSPDPRPRRRPSPSRRYSKTTSPPRHSRRDGAYSPPSKYDRRSSPPRTSNREAPVTRDSRHHSKHHKNDVAFGERPAVKRTKSLGQQGLHFLGEAAAMYAAAQAGSSERGRSPSRERDFSRRGSRHNSGSRHHRHHRRYSPSPSPSPPRRRSRAHSDAPQRRHRRHRSPSVSDESDYDHDRARRHRRSRASSYTESPPPSSRRHRSRRARSVASSLQSSRRDSKLPDQAAADRWQMAARAALEAGGLAAFRLRKEPGSWTGEKGAKVATAALGAAALDALIDKDPRRAKTSGMKGFAENTISSMIATKLMGCKGPTTRKGKVRY
ncbi:hypothetical protein GGR52DRAFT_181692 [Hypoxylon sp. FL1284]|nr:hypothetical protein GGR52DRAFT_181692 [Hypoxylon sp. FL1284]